MAKIVGVRTIKEWTDRNPDNRKLEFGSLWSGPHEATQRLSYTVPSGKKAIIQSVYLYLEIQSAATTPGRRYNNFSLIIDGSSVSTLTAWIQSTINVVGSVEFENITPMFILYPGDGLDITTADNGTGGTIIYYGDVVLAEYNDRL